MTELRLRGLEVDNLLGFLALLGLLRSLEEEKPDWRPKAWWAGPPWEARLHLAPIVDQLEVADAASRGVLSVAKRYDFAGRKNVDFDRDEFRDFAKSARTDPLKASLAAALAAELPQKDDGKVRPSPLVLLFGQGWQNFLDRLASVPRREERDDVSRALFAPWRREDETDAFRWDPQEDQRYALRFGNPSKAGAASTVHGANRLAAVGLLSYCCVPRSKDQRAAGAIREEGELKFVWPVWTEPLPLRGIEMLLCHPDLGSLRPLGVRDVYAARRVHNGKFMNVTRAIPRRSRVGGIES